MKRGFLPVLRIEVIVSMSSNLNKEQNMPELSSGDVWLLVMKDMEDRRQMGCKKYGTPLQPFNGRDALVDVYQELLDACVYIRQEIEQRIIKEQAK